MRAAALLTAALLAAACGNVYTTDPGFRPDATPPVKPPCGPSNCSGCCAGESCVPGVSTAACGAGGAQCASCTADFSCAAGSCVQDPWTVEGSGYDCRVPRKLELQGSHVEQEITLVSDGASHASCGTDNGVTFAQRAFEVVAPASGVLELEAEPVNGGSRWLGLDVYQDCRPPGDPWAHYACYVAPAAGEPVRLSIGAQRLADVYGFSVFDKGGGASGPVRLSLTAYAATCADPAPLRESGVIAARTGMVDHGAGSCGGAGTDAVFTLETKTPGNLRVRLYPSGQMSPVLYLRSACDGADLACAASSSLDVPDLAPGTYYLWVDNVTGTGAEFTMSAELVPLPPAGDVCRSPRALSFSPGPDGGLVASDMLDMKPFARNGDVSCQAAPGPDVVYELETDGGVDLSVSALWASAYTLTYGSCTDPEVVCRDVSRVTYVAERSFYQGGLLPGRYLLSMAVFDGYPLSMQAALTPSLPDDNCSFPRPLVFSAGPDGGGSVEVSGDTRGMHHDAEGSCNAGYLTADQVYEFTTTEVFDLRAHATGTTLFLRSSCRGGELACGNLGVAASSLLPGTYYLWVDSFSSPGPYTLTANLTPPARGDTCLNPQPLLLSADDAGVSLGVNATGSTYGLFNDYRGSCGGTTSSDVVYRLDTEVALNVQVTVSPTYSSYQPAVYLRGAWCDGGAEVACAAAPGPGGDATLSAPNLPAGTWYLFVDGLGNTSGPYTLTVTAQ